MDIKGAAAIVTGGASGLGAATARRLAAAGAQVVVVDLQDDAGKQRAAEINGVYARADVTDEVEVAAAVATAEEMGPLRVLVNCAGILAVSRTIDRRGEPHDYDLFRKTITINLVGSFNCIRLAAGAMAQTEALVDNERGAIVNTASVAAFDGQVGQAAYSASKGGIVGMTLPIARDLAAVGIRVNSVAPGIMETPMLAGLSDDARASLGQQVLHPKRLGTPQEYADLVHLLVTNSYMNGETIRMDGGIRMAPK
jgi:NAD(P)-dependent dehydrogenase (short-subunit alcohol dehydrogenase family)